MREGEVLEQNSLHPLRLGGGPAKQWQRAYDPQADLPLVALSERTNEHPLIWCNPFRMLVGELFEQVERALRDQPVLIGRQRGELLDARGPLLDEGSHPSRISDAAAVAPAKQVTKLRVHGHP